MSSSIPAIPLHERALTVRAGFTLLEVLVVIVLLSSLALAAVSLTDSADVQVRFETTQSRLALLKRAIVGDSDPTFGGQRLLSGYVVDNGNLPGSLSALVATRLAAAEFASHTPVFDPRPDAQGYNDGNSGGPSAEDEIPLAAPGERLFKGFRGPYVQLPPGSPFFRDGWGTIAEDAADDGFNHGWVFAVDTVSLPASTLRVASLGVDGVPDRIEPEDSYAVDRGVDIASADWQVDLAALTFSVRNSTETPVVGLRVTVLVYVYDTSDPANPTARWQRVNSTTRADIGSGESLQFLFAVDSLVPIGRHLALVIEDPDGTPDSGDDAPYASDSGERIGRTIDLYSRALPAAVELVVR